LNFALSQAKRRWALVIRQFRELAWCLELPEAVAEAKALLAARAAKQAAGQ
jgi:hypothetical protein